MSHVHAGRPAPRRALTRRLVTVGAVAVASVALVAPLADADTLSNLRGQVQATQAKQDEARIAVSESQENVSAATQRLLDSQAALDAAQAALDDLSVQLSAAKENDARIAQELEQARIELEAAKQRVAQAEADVAAQVALIGQAARESFQQQTDLQGLSVVFGAESPAELSQRLQWSTTIFDTQAAEKARLDQVRDELEAARAAQAEIEARIAAEKEESEQVVAQIASLESQAREQRAAVASLVRANEDARAAAQAELDADEAAFRTLEADETRLQKEITDELARLKAEADAKEAAAKEAERKAAAASNASSSSSSSSSASSSSGSSSGSSASGKTVSSYGFIRPVNAKYGSAFGLRFHPILKYWRSHNGVDMGASTGTPIYAARDGVVLKAGLNGGFGNFVLIGHGNIINGKYVTTGYAHQSRIVVKVGQQVTRGQLIGYVGNTGLSTTSHLHFELRLDGTPVNPVLYVP